MKLSGEMLQKFSIFLELYKMKNVKKIMGFSYFKIMANFEFVSFHQILTS